jgi:pyruvate dehydrogenase E1 component alpha subunit
MHTTADDPSKYRSEEEVREWERKDPLTRFGAYLRARNLLDEGLEEEVDQEIAAGVARFEALAQADPLGMFDHVYAVMPPHLAGQREELARWLRGRDAGAEGDPEPAPPMRGQRTTTRWRS